MFIIVIAFYDVIYLQIFLCYYKDFFKVCPLVANNRLSSSEKETYYTCRPFQNAINSQTTGNNLRIKFKSDGNGFFDEYGFAVTFKQKGIKMKIKNNPDLLTNYHKEY